MKITQRIPFDSDWIEPRETAVETVLYLYSTIRHRFKTDPEFGERFVAENQTLIGELVNAAVIELSRDKK
ncbi:hypothetical protein [Macellibacteroides fermentans]|uniref:hypothetical protein n=1 Tax=Macellibacteroides fermentans TaxID=879969 RepID=UPI00406C4423